MNRTLSSAIFSSPSDNLVFSAFFEFEMKKKGAFPNIICKGPATSSYSKFLAPSKKLNKRGH